MRITGILCAVVSALCLTQAASAATYTVTSNSSANTTGTFEWAIDKANEDSDLDTIAFSIGSGPVTIQRAANYLIFYPVIIDGKTQPGYSGTPLINIEATGGMPSVLTLDYGSDGSTITDLIFSKCGKYAGITSRSDSNLIKNCIFGTGVSHIPSLQPCLYAIDAGVSSRSSDLRIENCLIGFVKRGIRLEKIDGVSITGCSIGTDKTGVENLGLEGSGIDIFDCTDVYIGSTLSMPAGNVIANCGQDGIALRGSNDTIILQNRIFNIGETAIDSNMDDTLPLNDYLDNDIAGSSGQQNRVTTLRAARRNGIVNVSGDFSSSPNTNYTIEIFASRNPGSFYSGEAEFKVGLITGSSDAVGFMTFDEDLSETLASEPILYYSATATRTDLSWGTSEIGFSELPDFSSVNTDVNPGGNSAWVPSGIDSGPESPVDPTSPDDVDIDRVGRDLRIIVRESTARSRIAGWTTPDLATIPGLAQTVYRGKFYIYSTNPTSAPINEVPNFRLRIQNEGAVLASTTYEFATTGYSAPPYEPFYAGLNRTDIEEKVSPALRPGDNPNMPSLYRLDFLPTIVPASGGSRIGATFESYAISDTANGILALSELQIATYTDLPIAGTPYAYVPDTSFILGDQFIGDLGTPTDLITGQFNVEGNYEPGRLQALDLPGEVPDNQLAQTTILPAESGLLLDTVNVPEDKFGIGLFTAKSLITSETVRLTPGFNYVAAFVVSSDQPADPVNPATPAQGAMTFQIQTAGGAVTSRVELSGPASFLGPPGSISREIAKQSLPGSMMQVVTGFNGNYPAGSKGGTYYVFMPNPLDPDIRKESGGDLTPFSNEPGPGEDLPSYRDITVGATVISQPNSLKISPTTTIPWTGPQRAKITIHAVVLYEMLPIDDGGYEFILPPT